MKNKALIKFRKDHSLTQAQMAEELNISYSLYQKIESGERNLSFNFIRRMKTKFADSDINSFFANELHGTCEKPTGTG